MQTIRQTLNFIALIYHKLIGGFLMINRENLKYAKFFFLGILCSLILCVTLINTTIVVRASDKLESLPYSVYVNGDEVFLHNSLMKDGNTFIQLREFCAKLNVDVDWVDPSHHTLPVPGGNLPSGINLTSPTFIYTDEVTDFYDTDKKVLCVEITSIYEKYKMSEDKILSYAFDDEGLIIDENGVKKIIPLEYNPSNGRMYLKLEEFKEKVLIHLIDICKQEDQ